mmetsp:Transcript_28381/g.67170  ORF Transcript_28381/g.67170 Transcript_28381/m.67170 type:complete len:238 (-) Transcript_28381:308-1021(-)
MEPLPIPIRRASAPASMRLAAWYFVTTLPAMTSILSCVERWTCLIISRWYTLSPCALSRTTKSTPAATSASSLSRSSALVPMAAPTRSCLEVGFLVDCGKSWALTRSRRQMRETSSWDSLTMGSFPFLEERRTSSASRRVIVSEPTTRSRTWVMTSESGVDLSLSQSTSRSVTIPNSLPPTAPVSVIGMPEKPSFSLTSSTSWTVAVGGRHTGCVMNPFLWTLTLLTSAACFSADIL